MCSERIQLPLHRERTYGKNRRTTVKNQLERHRPGSRHLIRACVHSVEGPGPIRQSRVHGLLSTPLTEINVPSEGEPQDPDNGRDHIAQEPD